MTTPKEYNVTVEAASNDARALLVEASGLSANRVAEAMTSGAVWHRNQHGIRRIRRRSVTLVPGDTLHLNYDPMVLEQSCLPATLLRDGGRWSAWDKPFGMRSQGSKWGDHTTLGRFAEHHLEPPRESFIVHRLDMAATGIMLLAHDKKAAANITGQFAARTVGKRYTATVAGKFPSREQTFDSDIDGKSALTTATRIAYDPEARRSTLEVDIHTGRKHQIRRHLAEAGFPIIGDRMYGSDEDSEDLMLRSSYIAFDDPDSGERVKIDLAREENG